MARLPKGFWLDLRVMAELPDETSANAFACTIKEKATTYGRVHSIETKRYWKIREWFEVTVRLVPSGEIGLAFDGLISTLAENWQRHDLLDDERWALWNPGQGEPFDSRLRWALVECFLSTN